MHDAHSCRLARQAQSRRTARTLAARLASRSTKAPPNSRKPAPISATTTPSPASAPPIAPARTATGELARGARGVPLLRRTSHACCSQLTSLRSHSMRSIRADQPFCVADTFLWGALGHCGGAAPFIPTANASAVQNASQLGSWDADPACQRVAVESCDPPSSSNHASASADPPAQCAQWDFLSGDHPSDIRVPANSVADGWQLFETGNRTVIERGPSIVYPLLTQR